MGTIAEASLPTFVLGTLKQAAELNLSQAGHGDIQDILSPFTFARLKFAWVLLEIYGPNSGLLLKVSEQIILH